MSRATTARVCVHWQGWLNPWAAFRDSPYVTVRDGSSPSSSPRLLPLAGSTARLLSRANRIGDAEKLLKVTAASASANIKKLVDAEIVEERTGRKRDQVFVAMEIVRLMNGVSGRNA